MQIYVNEQELDAELAGEKTVEEVYEAVRQWSADNNKYILNLKVDAQEVSMGRLKGMGTDSIHRVDFYIGDEMDMVLSTLGETDRYIDQIGGTLFEQETLSTDDLANLLEGVHWIRQIMTSVAAILHLDLDSTFSPIAGEERTVEMSIGATLTRMESMAEAFSQETSREQVEPFLMELKSLKVFVVALSMQLRTMSAGREELLETVEEFDGSVDALVEELVGINRDFNSGEDATAMQGLEGLTERLNHYIAAVFALDQQLKRSEEPGILDMEIESISFATRADSLTSLLRDLSSALEENDIVAVGDILEYEVTEQLKDLRPYLRAIHERVAQT